MRRASGSTWGQLRTRVCVATLDALIVLGVPPAELGATDLPYATVNVLSMPRAVWMCSRPYHSVGGRRHFGLPHAENIH